MKSFLKDGSGQALILVVMLTLLLLLMATSLFTLVGESRKAIAVEEKMVQAYYIAEAGVERALAQAKSDGDWLWQAVHLAPGRKMEFLRQQAYADGVIAEVTIAEDSIYPAEAAVPEEVVYTNILITSVGIYEGSKKTLKVKAKVEAPLPFERGLWARSSDTDFGGAMVNANITVSGDLLFQHNGVFSGDISVDGTVTVAEEVTLTVRELKAAQSLILKNNACINGVVRQIGSAPAQIELADGASIVGDIYYNGELVNNSGTFFEPLNLHPGGAGQSMMPNFPLLDLSDLERNCDQTYVGDQWIGGDFQINGIAYVAGDVSIAGNYKGAGVIVAEGDVRIVGDLRRAQEDPHSSLAILSFGDEGVTIDAGVQVWALLYAPAGNASTGGIIRLEEGAALHGSLICEKISLPHATNTLLQYESALMEAQPDWTTTRISITSWQELYSVF